MAIVSNIRRIFFVCLFISGLAGCTAAPATRTEMVVYAASSLTDAFSEIATQFEQANPGVKVMLSFAGSNQLRVQIEQGARADVFASANTKEMDTLVHGGYVTAGNNIVFARNKLAIIVPKDNPAGIVTPKDLAKPGLKLVLADAKVPVGQYARQILGKFNADAAYGTAFSPTVLANVVSNEENVKQVVEKVQLGEADAGIVYISDVTPTAAQRIAFIAIPDAYNVIAAYPIAALKNAPQSMLADAFVKLVTSEQGQQVLRKWSFQAGD